VPASRLTGTVRIHHNPTPADDALGEIKAGLARNPKELPPKYFYDEQGCTLFERICELPEYYPTRAELALMELHAAGIARFLGADCELIEFGSGSGRKTRILLQALQPLLYTPVDIAASALEQASAALANEFPRLNIGALCADYTQRLNFPSWPQLPIRRRAVYFPGSTVGNFTREEALDFLRRIRALAGDGGALVIGVDLKKSPQTLHAAYNDAAGVTAAFNLNLLAHLNRVYGANFDLAGFAHVAFYDEAMGRIEMHLRSLRTQRVRLAGQVFEFAPEELMRTEISCKYSIEEFEEMARQAGFEAAQTWLDPQRLFCVHGLLAK